jgi:hypothetical protein
MLFDATRLTTVAMTWTALRLFSQVQIYINRGIATKDLSLFLKAT